MNNKNNQKKWNRHWFAALMVTFVVAACDGISGTGGPSRVADDTQGQTPENGQAVLGPIVGASVSVRDVANPDEIVCATTTTDNNDLSLAGAIAFSEPCIFAQRFYLVTVAGGTDVDFDDDGARDATPTPNAGEFRALLTGEQMLQGNWKANALTEAAFQGVQYALAQGADNISATLDDIARQFIQNDLNDDGAINRLDIALWEPVSHADAAINSDKLRFSTELIHHNLNRTLDEVPAAASLETRIDTLAPARQVLNLDNLLLVTTDSALLVYQQTDAGWQLKTNLALGWVYDMAVDGKTLYAALGDNGIAAIDLTDATNPRVTQRLSFATRRITTLGARVIFSFRTEFGGLQLREIDGEQSRLIADSENESVDRVRSFASDDAARNGVLKTLGNTVYWSTQDRVSSFTHENGEWINRLLLADNATTLGEFDIVDDIEIKGSTAYVVIRRAQASMAGLFDGFLQYQATPEEYRFDFALQYLDFENTVTMVDIGDVDHPAVVGTVKNEDIKAIRRWDDEIVALGANSITTRNPVDLQVDTQAALPSSFSGFDPVHGLVRVGDTIAVAARENGVLLLRPAASAAHFYTGNVMGQAAINGATVTVTRLSDNAPTCTQTSIADGAVTIPSDCLVQPGYYLLAASGGTQIVEGVDQPFMGELRTVMLSNTIAQSGWNITPLTELALRVAQTGDGVGFDAFTRAQDDIADWFLAAVRTNSQVRLHDASALFGWQPDATLSGVSFESQPWRDAVTANSNGSFDNAMFTDLISPVTNLLTFNDHINDVAIIAGAVFIAHDSSIDIVDRSVTPWQRHTISSGAHKLYAAGSTLVALDRNAARIDFYSVEDIDNIQRVASVSISNFSISSFAQECLSASMLYQVASDMLGSTVSAWRLGEAGATALTPLRLDMHIANVLGSDDLQCNDSLLVENWGDVKERYDLNQWGSNFSDWPSWSNDIDVFHVEGSTFEHTTTIDAPPTYGFDLHGSTLVIYTTESTGDKLFVYSIDTAGNAALVQQKDVALAADKPNAIQTRIRSNGSSIAVMSMNDITLFDANTLQSQDRLPIHFSALSSVTDDSGLWIWGLGNSIWQIGLPVAP